MNLLLILVIVIVIYIIYNNRYYECFNTYMAISEPFPRSPLYREFLKENPDNILAVDYDNYKLVGEKLDDYINLYKHYDTKKLNDLKCSSNQKMINHLINDKVKNALHKSMLLKSIEGNELLNDNHNTFNTPFSLFSISPGIDLDKAKSVKAQTDYDGTRECKTVNNKVICDVEKQATCGNIFNRNKVVTDIDCSKGGESLGKGSGWKYNPNSVGFTCTNKDCSIDNEIDLETCCIKTSTCGSTDGNSKIYSSCTDENVYDIESEHIPCIEDGCTSDEDKDRCCIDELDSILRWLLKKNIANIPEKDIIITQSQISQIPQISEDSKPIGWNHSNGL